MKTIKKPSLLLTDKHFAVLTILALGFVIGISVVGQKTQTQQYAAREKNLNTAGEIEASFNTDGTMGPRAARGNFSVSLPNVYLGNLVVDIKDSQAAEVKNSLKLTISKAEAHLVYLFIPGQNSKETGQGNPGNQKTNQNVNKWETLQLNGSDRPVNVDLNRGQDVSLGITGMAGGKYSEIRLYISGASAKLADGSVVDLTMPGHNNIIRVISPFNIYAGKTTTATLDLDQESSIIQEGKAYFLLPFISGTSVNN